MSRKILNHTFVMLVCGLMTTASYGQLLGVYDFDGGGDGTSWSDATNWEQVLDPFGGAISGNPATPPSNVTTADIPLAGVVANSAGLTALDVRIGTANGVGSLNVSAGDLTVRDVFVGRDSTNANAGSLSVSGGTLVAGDDIEISAGSVGSMTMSSGLASAGDDFFIHAGGSLVMTGGKINVGDRLITESNATLFLHGGDIFADDDFYFSDNSQITVNSGSMIVNDKINFADTATRNAKLTINGGLVRGNEFGIQNDLDLPESFQGVVEINGSGLFQIEENNGSGPITMLTLQMANDLIAEGVHLITSELAPKKLGASLIVVPSFDGRSNVSFVQISVVPEPASVLLLGLGAFALVIRRENHEA